MTTTRQSLTDTRSKADFRALRDLLGVTQRAVAERMGVTTMTVKTWENPNEFTPPSRAAWEWIEGLYARADREADGIVDMAVRATATARANGVEPDPVLLGYWRSASDYRELHGDDGDWCLANAVTRMAAMRLAARGVRASIAFAEARP